jgi:TPR repeat protein
MMKINHFIKLSSCVALIIAAYFVIDWENAEFFTPTAIQIATDDSLSHKEQFSAMVHLTYDDKHDPEALFLLYSMLYHGHGTTISPETALIVLEKSANAGYGLAQEELAFIYLHGKKYYKKDVYLAYYWLNIAARSGMKKSYHYLNN